MSIASSRDKPARIKKDLLVVVLYAIGAIVLFRPLGPFSTDSLPRGGIGDPAQMVWFLAYTPHAISHGLNLFSTTLIDYPTGVDLASNTSVPLLGIISWPITATLGPVASFNFLLRLGIFLSAVSLFFVLRRWSTSTFARFVGGLCYGFGPYVISQAVANAHINLLFVPLFPLMVWLLFELFDQQRRPWWWTGIGLGLCVSAQMWIAPELLSDFGVVAAVAVIVLALFHPGQVLQRLRYSLLGLGCALVVFIVSCGYLVWEMVKGPQHVRGPVYSVAHLQSFHNNLYETVLPTLRQLFSTTGLSKSAQLPTRNINEIGGYLSIPLIVVLVVGCILWRRRAGLVPLAIGVVIAFVLSLGDAFHIGTTKIALPEAVFTHLPLLQSTVPGRISLDTLLGCCCLLSIVIDQATRAIRRSSQMIQRYQYVGLGLVVAIVIAALFPRLPIKENKLEWPATTGSEIAAHVAPGAVVLTYPYPESPLDSAMTWQAEGGFLYSLLGAYATVNNPVGVGQEWPQTQEPLQIQEYLAKLELGPHSRYPRPKAPLSASALCTYIGRYHVSDIVVLHREVHSLAAAAYLTRVTHVVSFTNSTITIYHVIRQRLHHASSSC